MGGHREFISKGTIFHNIEYIEESHVVNRYRFSKFKCFCGNIFISQPTQIKNNIVKSCGCLWGTNSLRHGCAIKGKITSEYKAYEAAKERCYNSNCKMYANYGARGIIMCDRWLESFGNFLEDMGEKPSKEYSIDRINVNGNYCPENCKWSTMKEQQNNRRNNHVVEYLNQVKTISQWASIYNIKANSFGNMIRKYGIERTVEFYKNKNLIN